MDISDALAKLDILNEREALLRERRDFLLEKAAFKKRVIEFEKKEARLMVDLLQLTYEKIEFQRNKIVNE